MKQTDAHWFGPVKDRVMEAVKEEVICGASLGFIEPGRQSLSYFGKQGVITPYSEQPVRRGLSYDLASLSKVVGTTTRLLMLAEQGRLSLSTRISDVLPRFCYPEITVEQLLLHCSGLPAEITTKGDSGNSLAKNQWETRDCLLETSPVGAPKPSRKLPGKTFGKESWTKENLPELLYETEPECGPDERFLYSDVGFILLGKVVEVLDGMSLEESFQKYIFKPSGMEQTSFLTKGDKLWYVPTECTEERGCICKEVHDRKAFLLGPCGSAGLFSTLEDMARFTRLYLERSELLFTKETFSMLEEKERFGRTLGWSKEYGKRTLYHTGFTGTSILMDLKQEKVMILLTNRIHPKRENEEFLKRRKLWNQLFLDCCGNHN